MGDKPIGLPLPTQLKNVDRAYLAVFLMRARKSIMHVHRVNNHTERRGLHRSFDSTNKCRDVTPREYVEVITPMRFPGGRALFAVVPRCQGFWTIELPGRTAVAVRASAFRRTLRSEKSVFETSTIFVLCLVVLSISCVRLKPAGPQGSH